MDETFSNLDEQSKNRIYLNILQNSQYSERTMLIISHHLDIVDYVDYVIYIDNETGDVYKDTHINLMESNENYRNFINSKI